MRVVELISSKLGKKEIKEIIKEYLNCVDLEFDIDLESSNKRKLELKVEYLAGQRYVLKVRPNFDGSISIKIWGINNSPTKQDKKILRERVAKYLLESV